MSEVVGAQEIGELFGGLSRQRVQQIVSRDDFPAPIAHLGMGKVWRTADVRAWAEAKGRPMVEKDALDARDRKDSRE
jgi:prophage regulatory protein